MKNADFRLQTGVPSAPVAGVVGLYANASGALVQQNSNGAQFSIGSLVTGVIPNASVIGPVGTGIFAFQPTGWLAYVGPTGQKFAVPVFTYN